MKDIGLLGLLLIVVGGLALTGILLANIPMPPQLVGVNQPAIKSTGSVLSWVFDGIGNWLWHSIWPF